MATRVELPKQLVHNALNVAVNSINRSVKSATNPVIKDALEKELAEYTNARNTLSEIK